jgi:hypothetical protein
MTQRKMSDVKATLLGCGCLLIFVIVDIAVTAGVVYLLLLWFGVIG